MASIRLETPEPLVRYNGTPPKEEGIMSTPSLGTIAKESVGWSIALSVLMILTGVLAIMIPPLAGIAVLVVVAWLLMFSGAGHRA